MSLDVVNVLDGPVAPAGQHHLAHPVGAEDNDLLVSREIFPLAEAFAAVRRAFDREHEHQRRLATIFNCA